MAARFKDNVFAQVQALFLMAKPNYHAMRNALLTVFVYCTRGGKTLQIAMNFNEKCWIKLIKHEAHDWSLTSSPFIKRHNVTITHSGDNNDAAFKSTS